MSRTTRTVVGLAAAALMSTLVTPDPVGAAPLNPWSCTPGAFCAYPQPNGKGGACGWQIDDPDWLGGSSVCKWSRNTRVKSVVNNGTSGRPVSIYTRAGLKGTKVLCLKKGQRLNLKGAGTFVRSHTWKC
ncbi:peptidase inhibitor family I36 protein [Streptomyces sp. NPDC005794]|uniref:peptidase inhibitor family I36 protein n=1 Tax=Streptomyces sp. NPDC005794 TaxID=3364733 RepID=UPI0036934062